MQRLTKTFSSVSLALLFGFTLFSQASAQDNQQAISNPLSGSVQMNRIRLNRRYATPPAPNPDYYNMNPHEAVVNVNDYAGSVMTAAPAPPPPPKISNYIWGLSRDGGYYDATGQIKIVVPGDQLYKYGGTFMDGTAVPVTPVVTNFANHAYRFPYVIRKN
ncbi:MAG: hypothetical protein K2W82_11915 [Candidatus Obscuribacterales bacterium]|jgi:hypothetical protein|nr:hypothetical protein [Candidatus Obscuribacterales bacterium]